MERGTDAAVRVGIDIEGPTLSADSWDPIDLIEDRSALLRRITDHYAQTIKTIADDLTIPFNERRLRIEHLERMRETHLTDMMGRSPPRSRLLREPPETR